MFPSFEKFFSEVHKKFRTSFTQSCRNTQSFKLFQVSSKSFTEFQSSAEIRCRSQFQSVISKKLKVSTWKVQSITVKGISGQLLPLQHSSVLIERGPLLGAKCSPSGSGVTAAQSRSFLSFFNGGARLTNNSNYPLQVQMKSNNFFI